MKLLAILFAVLALAGCAGQGTGTLEYVQYEKWCKEKGGIVTGAASHWSYVEYKCIGPQQSELLPRLAE